MNIIDTYSPPMNAALPAIAKSSGSSAAMETAKQFEQVFLTTYLESMFSGVKTEAPFGGGTGENVFRSMLLNEYAGEMSHSGGIGIADQVYREMLKMQEINQ